ncbi:hypothetical protein VT98_14292 [Candidatus Electrothrix communis]|uniref:Uncharacterized protein n=1 Tax=Candidatus Electrothrix communis TaxID=1859133 RepID=A0A444IRU8_9BACT|nr:hypothetical protein VT98_14292 [Candidatus Electrothrix communis]
MNGDRAFWGRNIKEQLTLFLYRGAARMHSLNYPVEFDQGCFPALAAGFAKHHEFFLLAVPMVSLGIDPGLSDFFNISAQLLQNVKGVINSQDFVVINTVILIIISPVVIRDCYDVVATDCPFLRVVIHQNLPGEFTLLHLL